MIELTPPRAPSVEVRSSSSETRAMVNELRSMAPEVRAAMNEFRSGRPKFVRQWTNCIRWPPQFARRQM